MTVRFGTKEIYIADERQSLCEVSLAGEDNLSRCNKRFPSTEGGKLKYVRHMQTENKLTVVQESDKVQTVSHFVRYADTNVLRTFTEVQNISDEEITLEYVSALTMANIGSLHDTENIFLYRFTNSWHCEVQPRKISLFDSGLFRANRSSFKRVFGANTGSWSTKEELPQAIIYNAVRNEYTMFQIESSASWYWEISEYDDTLYLLAGGADQANAQWCKRLKSGETYRTPYVAYVQGDSADGVITEMTKYRRHIAGKCAADENLPVIFNEYMHLSWDSPNEECTARMLPRVKAAGADIYVIDCGWHNEEPGDKIYPYVGQWRESKARFPKGIKHTIDLIHSYGLKAGLWLEPEIIGKLCEEMLAYYPANAYLMRNGKPIVAGGRRFLDFRCRAVTNYLNGVIDTLVGEYGVDYLKFDYNQDCGAGTEQDSDSLGDGMEKHTAAYFDWIRDIQIKYPALIIETCSSGGQRMDYRTLSHFSIVSTSDQTDYRKYPYIAANVLTAVLPEQAAVWNYPVVGEEAIGEPFKHDKKWVQENISYEQIVMNTVNALLGRMHLASHIELLSSAQFSLVKEGIGYYNKLTPIKKIALPYFPLGFTSFGAPYASCGLKTADKIYLAVWNLGAKREVCIPIPEGISAVTVGYPKAIETDFAYTENALTVRFDGYAARFFEIETGK